MGWGCWDFPGPGLLKLSLQIWRGAGKDVQGDLQPHPFPSLRATPVNRAESSTPSHLLKPVLGKLMDFSPASFTNKLASAGLYSRPPPAPGYLLLAVKGELGLPNLREPVLVHLIPQRRGWVESFSF